MWRIAPLVAVLAAVPANVGSQVLTGRVADGVDSAGISGVRIESANRATRSDAFGNFRLELGAGQHTVTLRGIGYSVLVDTVDLRGAQDTATFYMARIPQQLSTMIVHGRALRVPAQFADVYRRAQMTNGVLLTREQIDSLNMRDVAGLLNSMPPLRVNPNREAQARLSTPRCSAWIPGGADGGQRVELYLNGVRLGNTVSINEVLDHMAPTDIQVIEMYNGMGSMPALFQPACAAVAVWTRGR